MTLKTAHAVIAMANSDVIPYRSEAERKRFFELCAKAAKVLRAAGAEQATHRGVHLRNVSWEGMSEVELPDTSVRARTCPPLGIYVKGEGGKYEELRGPRPVTC